jgi:hypothetical protein
VARKPLLTNALTEDLLIELVRRGEDGPPLAEVPDEELMHALARRSDASLCVTYKDFGATWKLSAVGRGVMGPMLRELMFGMVESDEDAGGAAE